MAIKVPTLHYSTASFYNGLNFQGSTPQKAGAFVKPELAGLGNFLQGLQQLNEAQHKSRVEEKREQLDLDLMREMQQYQEDTHLWTQAYTTEHQGANARNAAEDARAFHERRLEEMYAKFGHNPTAQQYLEKNANQLGLNHVNSMRSFSRKQDELYKASVLAGEEANALRIMSDPAVSEEERETVWQDYARKIRIDRKRHGLDPTPAIVKAEEVRRKGQSAYWNNRFAILLESDPERARQMARHARRYAGASRATRARAVTLPADVAGLAEKEAAAQGVSPDLVKAVIATESGGTQSAVSRAGARGLMQLMPGTAKDLGVNPDDAAQNVRGGITYLKRMLEKYNGDERLALAAYNWGPGNVDNFLKTGLGVKGQPMPRETKDYVERILGAPLEPDAGGMLATGTEQTRSGPGAAPEDLVTSAGPKEPAARTTEQEADPQLLADAEAMRELFTPLELIAFENKAEAALQKRQAESKQAAAGLLANEKNYLAYGVQTGDYSPASGLASQLDTLGLSKEASAVREQVGLLQAFDPFLRDGTQPLAARADEVRRIFRTLDAPENASALEAAYGRVEEQLQQQAQRFARDPADYVAGLSALQEEGVTGEAYVARSLALQETIGAGLGVTPKVVPQAVADRIRALYSDATDAGKKVDLILELTREYGTYAPQALAEARIPEAVSALVPVLAELPRSTASRLVQAAEMSLEEMESLDRGTRNRHVRTARNSRLCRTLREVREALFVAEEPGRLYESMVPTLANYLALGGRLADVEDRFMIINDSNMAVILPRWAAVPGIETALEVRRRELARSLQESHGPGKAESFARDQYRSMYAQGVWIFNGQDFSLIDPVSGREASAPDGTPVRVAPGQVAGLRKRAVELAHHYPWGTYWPPLARP